MHDIGLENLRFGIVEQAVDDYLSLLAGFIVPTTNCNLAELERFFYSDWFRVHYRESEKKGEEDDSEIYRIKAERQ